MFALVLLLSTSLVTTAPASPDAVLYTREDFSRGVGEGVRADPHLRLDIPAGSGEHADALGRGTWEWARWTGPERAVGFPATELIVSWTADTPPGTWLEAEVRGRNATGLTRWFSMGRWAYGDADILRASVPGQRDRDGRVKTDTFVAAGDRPVTAYQVRLTLHRSPGTGATPAVRSLGVMASAVPRRREVAVSAGGQAWGRELKVPRRSQNAHRGHYPQWNGGGEAWCSPTSVAMVLAYWGRGPARWETAWVDPSDPAPEVDHAARHVYDYVYAGAGNWPFNTAYAGHYGLEAFVTRLRSLAELEGFIAAGVPVVTSQSFTRAELPGAGYGTDGHLMVVVGFTRAGDVIANDPNAGAGRPVRRVYPRAAFENVWLRGSGSRGVAYIMHPPGHALPPKPPGVPAAW
ncbi:C39 family peptidase [Sinosporangium siamense]|nr:C39 family peptidase [Sinosporangium siamense]